MKTNLPTDLFNTLYSGAKSLVSRKLGVTAASMYGMYEMGEPLFLVLAGAAYVLSQALVETFGKK